MWRSFQDRRREEQALELLDHAQRERVAGRRDEALRAQLDALELIRALADAHPGDPRHQQATASALYTLAAMQTQVALFAEALGSLAECEQLYLSLGDMGFLDATPLAADVRVRRAHTLMLQGRGASAVPEMDSAMATYAELDEADESNALRRDLARVLAMNAVVLARFGDPDLACASADSALRIYLSNVTSPGTFTVQGEDAGYLRQAAAVGAALHVQHGRPEIGLVAANFGLQLTGQGGAGALDHVRSLTDNVDQLSPEDLAALDREFTRSMRRVTQCEAPPGSEIDRLQRTTLSGALTVAEDHGTATELADVLTRPVADGEIVFPAQRCPSQIAALRARQLGALALDVLPTAPIDGLRIALEAHYLFASASRAQVAALRYQLQDFGPIWARALLASSAAFEARGQLPMALDLASWAADLARQLVPFAHTDSELAPLVRDCVERQGRLLIDTGDRGAGDESLSTARTSPA
ncbi:hypothetical protein [Micromonospora sp. NPDC049679]|uniref:hypothetical protein n=1 Tax=Micromonospora sp. NPDC049679 TaxID=3155920 RepID=UPI0033DC3764